MKKFLLLATMFLFCAGAASAQNTGQQGQGGTAEPSDNAKSSNLEGRKYGAASEPGSDGSNLTVANPGGSGSAPAGPSSTTNNGSVSPAAEELNNDVAPVLDRTPPRR